MDALALEIGKAAQAEWPLSDAEAEQLLWDFAIANDKSLGCPRCSSSKCYPNNTAKTRFGSLKCGTCFFKWTPLSGTIFHGMKLPSKAIVHACMILSMDHTTPCTKLGREIQTTEKSAYNLKKKILGNERRSVLDPA